MKRLKWDDRGQITTALVIVVTVLVVGLAMLATKLGQATDEKGQVQIAADAAALAAAQRIGQDDLPEMLTAFLGGDPHAFGCRGTGREAASDFAQRGGARLTQYCYYSGSGTVEVSVDSLSNSASGSPAKAQAVARVGLALDDCVPPQPPARPTQMPTTEPAPAPPATASTTPPPPATATTPPPDVDGEAHCGEATIRIVFDGESGKIRIDMSGSEIRKLFTPSLTS
jgi:hypothetical protein